MHEQLRAKWENLHRVKVTKHGEIKIIFKIILHAMICILLYINHTVFWQASD